MWNVLLMLVLVVSLFVEVKRIYAQKLYKDLLVFGAIWGIALLSVILHMLELPGLRPLDWISAALQPLNKLLS